MATEGKAGPLASSILLVLAALAIGIMIGLAVYTFVFARGASYLSSDPNACINCHVMNEQYDSWIVGPHQSAAVCADCHLPHDNIVAKYAVKAENGFMHGLKFTTGWYPENIEARQISLDVTNRACLYCHADLTDDIRHPQPYADDAIFDCIRCHSGIGHD